MKIKFVKALTKFYELQSKIGHLKAIKILKKRNKKLVAKIKTKRTKKITSI